MATEPSETPFSRMDDTSSEVRQALLGYLDKVAAHPEMQRVRSAALEIFAPAAGERLLDAGCGLGEVARQLGARVGAKGSVVAVDRSAEAIAVAESRSDTSPVTYTVGDMTALDFPEGHFDGVRCERVLQHMADPDSAIKELVRMTRPGGRVCVIETDWSSSVAEGFEHLDEIRAGLLQFGGHNPDAGRTIRSRMVRAGLEQTTAFPVTLRFLSPDDAAVVAPFFNQAVWDHLPREMVERFSDSVDRSAARGDFLFAFTMWICLGRVALAEAA